MKLTCNINWLGRIVRIAIGAILLWDAYIMYARQFPGDGVGSTVLQVVVAALGAFCIFEGVTGWCAARAMGIKTPV